MDLLLFIYMFSFLYHCHDFYWTWLYIYELHDGRIIRSINCLPFASTGVNPRFFLCFLFVLSYYVCVFTFWIPCYEVRYDFRIMFVSSLFPVVCRRAHVLFTLFVHSDVLHILCCVFFVVCTQFLWIVHLWLALLCSLTLFEMLEIIVFNCFGPVGLYLFQCVHSGRWTM